MTLHYIEWATPKELEPYMEAYKQEQRNADADRYYQGLYIQCAIGACFSKEAKYPVRPFFEEYDPTLTEQERKQKEIDEFVMAMKAMEANWNATHKYNNGGME